MRDEAPYSIMISESDESLAVESAQGSLQAPALSELEVSDSELVELIEEQMIEEAEN
jgi:hypothetical protein